MKQPPTKPKGSSPLQVIRSIAKSITKAGKQVVARASGGKIATSKLTKTISSGSIMDMLPGVQSSPRSSCSSLNNEKDLSGSVNNFLEVRPLRDLPGQAKLSISESEEQNQPNLTLSPRGNIFSPTQQNHSDDEVAIANLSPLTDSQVAQGDANQSQGNTKSKRGTRRSRRLRREEVERIVCPRRNVKEKKDTKGKNK